MTFAFASSLPLLSAYSSCGVKHMLESQHNTDAHGIRVYCTRLCRYGDMMREFVHETMLLTVFVRASFTSLILRRDLQRKMSTTMMPNAERGLTQRASLHYRTRHHNRCQPPSVRHVPVSPALHQSLVGGTS
jgi:hypothetical protein